MIDSRRAAFVVLLFFLGWAAAILHLAPAVLAVILAIVWVTRKRTAGRR